MRRSCGGHRCAALNLVVNPLRAFDRAAWTRTATGSRAAEDGAPLRGQFEVRHGSVSTSIGPAPQVEERVAAHFRLKFPRLRESLSDLALTAGARPAPRYTAPMRRPLATVRGNAVSTAAELAKSPPRSQVVARNSIWLTLDAIVAVPVSLALSVLVARKIGPDVLGLYNFANWLLGAGVVVFTNGVSYGMQVFAAEKLGQNDFAGATCPRYGLLWQLGLIALLVPSGIALTLTLCPPQFQVALLIAVASIAPAILISVPAAGIGAAQALAANAVPSMVAAFVNLAAAVAALESGWGLVGVTSALLASRVVDAGLRFIAWRRVWSGLRAAVNGGAAPGAETVDTARLRRYAWNTSLLLLVGTIVWDRSEFFVLTRFSSLREVAFYSLSFNIVQQVLILPRVFTQGIPPTCWSNEGAIREPPCGSPVTRCVMSFFWLRLYPRSGVTRPGHHPAALRTDTSKPFPSSPWWRGSRSSKARCCRCRRCST